MTTLRELAYTSGRWKSMDEAQAVAEYLSSLGVTTPAQAAKILPYVDAGGRKYLKTTYGSDEYVFLASNGLRVVVTS